MEIQVKKVELKFLNKCYNGTLLKTPSEKKSSHLILFHGTSHQLIKNKKMFVGLAENHLRKLRQVLEHATHILIKHAVTTFKMNQLLADLVISYLTHAKVTLQNYLFSSVLHADQQLSNSL